jgi:nucleoside diphosphate kinase
VVLADCRAQAGVRVTEAVWVPRNAGPAAESSAASAAISDELRNAVHGSANCAAAVAELACFFGHPSNSIPSSSSQGAPTADRLGGTPAIGNSGGNALRVASCCRCRDTTLGVVLPHAVKEGVAGAVLAEIQATGRFDVTGLQLFSLGKQVAAEFLEVRVA